MMTSKWNHFYFFILVTLAGVCVCLWKPELLKDPPTVLGTIGFFAGLYGIAFAIVELLRSKSLSEVAAGEAKRAFVAVTNLTTAREIVDCQHSIKLAIATMDEGKPIPSPILAEILSVYSQVFHNEVADPQSEHRKTRSTIEAYSFSPSVAARNPRHTRQALLVVTGQLAQLQGSTKNFTEYQR